MKISRENWESSKEKWEKVLKNIRNRNKLRVNDRGRYVFYDVAPVELCGYCAEHSNDCRNCPLYPRTCAAIFDDCVAALEKADYSTALKHAKKIYQAILDDEVNVYEEEG
jgi:hypothetical protein